MLVDIVDNGVLNNNTCPEPPGCMECEHSVRGTDLGWRARESTDSAIRDWAARGGWQGRDESQLEIQGPDSASHVFRNWGSLLALFGRATSAGAPKSRITRLSGSGHLRQGRSGQRATCGRRGWRAAPFVGCCVEMSPLPVVARRPQLLLCAASAAV